MSATNLKSGIQYLYLHKDYRENPYRIFATDFATLVGGIVFVAGIFYFLFGTLNTDPVTLFLKKLPQVDSNDAWWATQKALFRSITRSMETVADGYDRFTRREKLFVLPSLGAGTLVIMPPSQLNLLNRPEREIGAWDFKLEIFQPQYTMGSRDFCARTMNCAFNVVWKRLPREAHSFAPIVLEELDIGFQKFWGTKSEPKTVNLFDSCARIISRAANRTFFGLPLCHDERLLEATSKYAGALFSCASLISPLPPAARAVFGPLVGWPARRYMASCKKLLMPMVAARLAQYKNGEPGPNDFLQWLISEYQTTQPSYMDENHISQSLLILNVISIYSTSYTIANSILGLCSSPDFETYTAGLREEAQEMLEHKSDASLGDIVQSMNGTDSCIREGLRLSSFHIVTGMRAVSHPNGIQLENLDEKVSLPQGTRFGFAIQSIHRDERYYPNPNLFDAFRFSRPFERSPYDSPNSGKQLKSTITTQEFLSWGFGRHACPGRVYATQMMKIALSYIVQHYDIEPITQKPTCQPVLNVLMPPSSADITVKWRGTDAN